MAILISGCVIVERPTIEDTKYTRSPEAQREIDTLLAVDAENKRWQMIYLKEISIAMENNDYESYRFFITELIRMPRLKLPDWLKDEPGYIPSIISIEELTE